MKSVLFMVIVVCFAGHQCRNVADNNQQQRVKRTSDANGFSGEVNCEHVNLFLRNSHGVPTNNGIKGSACNGQCCDANAEAALKKVGQRKFAELLSDNSKSLQATLRTTSSSLQNHVTELAHQSENKTLLLVTQVYRQMAVHLRMPVANLFADIRHYVSPAVTTAGTSPLTSSMGASSLDPVAAGSKGEGTVYSPPVDISVSVQGLFNALFPLVYHHHVSNQAQPPTNLRDFTTEYKACLRDRVHQLQPFGGIPLQIAQSLAKSLESSRLLLQALDVGLEVLNATDALITEDNGKSNAECHTALLRLTHCPRCQGYSPSVKPCSGYCLNVVRGCLTRYVSELEAPWNGLVEALQRLVTAIKQHNNEAGVNADAVIRMLDTRVSEAIMYAMERMGDDMDSKLKRVCGPPSFSTNPLPPLPSSPTASSLHNGGSSSEISTRSAVRMPSVVRMTQPSGQEHQLQMFLVEVEKSRGFYGQLADSLCRDGSFAELKDKGCWNGERLGEYTKTVVDAGVDMQKYNPEVKPNTSMQDVDDRVANLADKLRHYSQMVMSSLGAVGLPESDSFMQGDGTEGSGSGGGPNYDDTEDVHGSGSGDGHDGHHRSDSFDKSTTENVNHHSPKGTATQGTAGLAPAVWLSTLSLILLSMAMKIS